MATRDDLAFLGELQDLNEHAPDWTQLERLAAIALRFCTNGRPKLSALGELGEQLRDDEAAAFCRELEAAWDQLTKLGNVAHAILKAGGAKGPAN